jgi:hypothetical protein
MEDVLGFESYQEEININELSQRIAIARTTLNFKDMPDKTQYQKRGNIYTSTKGKEYMLQLIDTLELLVKWCQKRGYTTVYIA